MTETLAREGRTRENQADLALGMALAEAHVQAIVDLLRVPYRDLDFSGVLDALRRWDGGAVGSSASHAAAYVRVIQGHLREVVSVYFDARTQRLVWDGACDSHFADVGFHGGLQQDQLKLRGFGVQVDWDRVPVLGGDGSADGFWWSLVLVQTIALQAGRGGGSVGSMPVPLPSVAGSPPTPPTAAGARTPQRLKLFDRVAPQPSEHFAGSPFPALRIETTNWDPTPYAIAPSVEVTFFVGSGQTVFLAGDSAGVEAWEVDNFLLVEVLQGGRQGEVQRFVIGAVEPVYFSDMPLPQLGDLNQAAFSPSESDITAFFEPATQARVRVHALDYGGLGFVSEIYLIVR